MENRKHKIIRMSNVPSSMDVFCKDLFRELSKDYEIVALSSPGIELDRVRDREGVRVISVPIERRFAPFKDLSTLRKLVRIFKEEKPDMVHTMNPKAGLLGMMAAKWAGVPCRAHSFTGLVFPTASGLKRYILKKTDRITCRCATHILPEGEGVRRDLRNNRITSKPMKILGYGNIKGVDLDYFQRTDEVMAEAQRLRKENGGEFTYIFIGRFVADKGVGELVDSFCRLLEKGKDVRLMILGEMDGSDPVGKKYRDIISSTKEIIHVGPVFDVRPYLAASDCLVLPSYREGFPNSVIEAGAMGIPSVVTDINGANEIISKGINGLIVPPKDVEELTLAMETLLEDEDMRKRMASVCRDMVLRYDRRIVWNSLKEFYASALEKVK